MTKNYISFNGGISTEPEVNLLIEKLGIPEPGDQIAYKQICEVIGIENRRLGRWISVVTAWRKRLYREHNILFKAVPNEGYEVLSNSGRVNYGAKTYKEGLRRVGWSVKVISATDRIGLSDEEKRAAEHIQKIGASLRLTAQTAARELKHPELDKAAES